MTADPPARRRLTAALAIAMTSVAIAGSVTTLLAAIAGGITFAQAVGAFAVTDGAMGLAFPACGLLLAWHRPRNPIGWLFLAAGAGMATSAAAVALAGYGARSGWPEGSLRLLGTLFAYSWPWSAGLFLPLALQLFPDGRPAGRRWRWLIWATAASSLVFAASYANPAAVTIGHRRLTLYLTIPAYRQLAALWAAGNLLWLAVFAATIASLAIRYRRGSDVERRQLLWLLLAGLAVLAYVGVVWGVFAAGPVLGLLVLVLIPAAVTIAILRYQLLDIRLVVSRALVYGVLTAGSVAAYAGMVAIFDALVRTRVSLESAVAASVIVAVCFNPARARLQRRIDRALYGDRRDPVRAVSAVGLRLASTQGGLAGVLEALCGSLRLPFAAVRYGSGEAAVFGTMPELLHSTALSYDGARIGELVVGLRSGQRRLGPPDVAVLELLAAPLAVALHATALSAALQQSRAGIVTAREEERRRLRRDLHDGLGPALTGIAFKADAARNILPAKPDQAGELLAQLRADTTDAITDIRRLVYGLRPPAIDDLGLAGSLRQQSARLAQRGDGSAVPVVIEAPQTLAALPAAIEVAAYRIVTEALTNAARHSGATRIDVSLQVAGGELRIEVRDDGSAPSAGWMPGLGLVSMRERATELGGSCQAGPAPGGGGRVTASLPLGAVLAPASQEPGQPGPSLPESGPAAPDRAEVSLR